MPEDNLAFTDDEIEIAVEQLRHFLDAVLEPDQLYELRPVPWIAGGSIWATPADIPQHVPTLMKWNRARVNPYFSVNPRKHHGATKGIDTLPGSLIVADFDSGLTLDAVKAKLVAAGLPEPTAIVCTSQGHFHVWWRLEERLPDLATFKRLQRGLAEALGSCPSVNSFSQVMRMPGPFCNVKPGRPDAPRVQLIACDPNRIYPVNLFPMAAEEPTFEIVPLEKLAVEIAKGSMADKTRSLVELGQVPEGKGRRGSIYEAARDLHGRGWQLADAMKLLVAVGEKLGLESDDVQDLPRQVKRAFGTPASPGFAEAECATIDFSTCSPTPVADDDYDAELEAIPLPQPPALPPRPDLALRHGVIGDFMRRVELETEAHPVALATSLIVAIGNVIGRGPHTVVGRTPHHVNLFLAVVGATGAGRKGTGGDIIRDCVSMADPYWAEHGQSPNLVSGEGVIDALRDRVTKMVPVKGGGPDEFEQVVIDPGVEDKRLLITCAELVSAFKAGNRENSTLAQTLREAWDGKTLRTMAKNCARTATDPHLSIIGHATRHELLKVVREADVFGGSMNRFLWILSQRARLLPFGGDLDDLGTVPQRIADVVTFARTVGRMRRSPEADRLWATVYGDLTTTSGSELLAAVLSRGEAQVLRLSMLMALAAGRDTIEVDDLAAALDLWRYSEASARAIFSGVHDELTQKVLDTIVAHPGITRTQLHRKVGWRLPSAELVKVLGRIGAGGQARSEKVETDGKAAEKWWPAEPTGCDWGAWCASPDPKRTNCTNPLAPAAPAVRWDPDNLTPGTFTV
jgi:hypothetical protein